MTKHFEFKILDDEDRILRDGETFTHRMMMRDSISKPLQDALDATEALKLRDAAAFANSRRPGFHYADSAVDSRAEARARNRQLSYDEYSRDISEAWRGKAPVADGAADPRQAWHDARNAAIDSNAPIGAYPASSGEGTVCTINGKPGHLKSTGDGSWLSCQADDGSGDGIGDSRSAASRRATMVAAYSAVDLELQNAWRKPAQF